MSARLATGAEIPNSPSPAVIRLGSLEMEPATYGSQGSAVLGTRDSGKTYTATLIAEQLFAAGVPFTVFDPVGMWRFLRVPGLGPGLPVVIAGGVDGDLALTPATAPAIVEAAMQNGVSLVLDLHSIEMTKADWRRIVRDSVRLLLHKNAAHGLRHIFIEEAHEFVPQVVRDGLVYAEMEKLATMGGNARLGYTLVSQRAEQVNKAVLELCENLLLHRQRGRNSLTSLGKWLNVGNVADHQAIIRTLSSLPTGECWAWLGGSDAPVRVRVQAKSSFHPNRRMLRGESDLPSRASVDVNAFVAMMRASLPKLEAEGPTESDRTDGAADPLARAKVYAEGRRDGLVAGRAERQPEIDRLRGNLARLASVLDQIGEGSAVIATTARQASMGALALSDPSGGVRDVTAEPAERTAIAGSTRVADDPDSVATRPLREAPPYQPMRQYVAPDPRQRRVFSGEASAQPGELPTSAKRLLEVLVQRAPARMTWRQIATLAGLKAGGGYFNTGVRALRGASLVEEAGSHVWASETAIAAAGGKTKRRQTPVEALAMWCEKLPAPSPAMLRRLSLAGGSMALPVLAEVLGLQPRGGFWNKGVSMLRNNGLIEIRGGVMQLVAELQ